MPKVWKKKVGVASPAWPPRPVQPKTALPASSFVPGNDVLHWQEVERREQEKQRQIDLAELSRQRERQQKDANKALHRWLRQNERRYDIEGLAKSFKKRSRSFSNMLLDATLSNLAMNDGLRLTNEALNYALGMEGVVIPAEEFDALANKVLSVNLFRLMLQFSKLDPKSQQFLFNRHMAREFPLKDTEQKLSTARNPLPSEASLEVPDAAGVSKRAIKKLIEQVANESLETKGRKFRRRK